MNRLVPFDFIGLIGLAGLVNLAACSESGVGGSAADASGRMPVVIASTALRPPPDIARALGVYEIDAQATGRRAGFLGPLVEAAVRGSTLELKADMSYVGKKDGRCESAGRWSIDGGRLLMQQTHERGTPSRDRGAGTIEKGQVRIKTEGRGVLLIFQRRRTSSIGAERR